MEDLRKAKELLAGGTYTCVLCKDSNVLTCTARGVRPLVQWLASGTDLQGFSAADKVVGKATAYLYVLLGVRAVYSHVISKGALNVLQSHAIDISYGTLADHIINRAGDGICPFEQAVENSASPEDAYRDIRRQMEITGITIQ